MMKFQNFEALYGAACEIFAAAGENPAVAAAVAKQKKVLLAQFAANFPSSLANAEAHPQFDVMQFMNMLLKFPETLGGKGEKLFSLLNSFEDHGIDVPAELKQICENLREKPKAMSEEEKKLLAALKEAFPDSLRKLRELPFKEEKVIAFLVAWPDAVDGKRREFINLMGDLCQNNVNLPLELKNQWRGMVMQP
ncbi:MAG: hypothetical protein V8R89_07595 [Alphaproteobacteria bacterium]|jgi:hypothetical protein